MKLLLANPRRRRKSRKAGARKAKKTIITVQKNPRRRRRSHKLISARRNPRFGGLRSAGKTITTKAISTAKIGAIAGAGALAADVLSAQALRFLPLPPALKTGTMQQITQAAIAILGGMAIEKFANKEIGQAIAVGGVTVATYNLGRALLAGKDIPGLGGSDDGLLAYELGEDDGLLAYEDDGMDAYESEDLGAYSNGAPIVD